MAQLINSRDFHSIHIPSVGSGVRAWLGLRYAEVPQRFGQARPVGGQLRVDQLADVPVFPQKPSRLNSFMGAGRQNPQSEHAHFLNVWAPDNAEGLPVLFFIHGGAWMTGGGAEEWYDGTQLAALGMVVVTVNYRLGPVGHLGDQSQLNLPLPLEDLLVALRWVYDKIGDYGGDPDRITVVGQSAGGWYGHVLSMLETTHGMIQQVAHLSMGTRTPWTQEHQLRIQQAATQSVAPASLKEVSGETLLTAGSHGLQSAQRAAQQTPLAYAGSGYLPVLTSGMPKGFLDPQQAARKTHAKAVYLRWTQEETSAFFWNSPDHLNATQEQVDTELSLWSITDLPETLLQHGTYAGATSGLSPYRQLIAASSWNQFQRFPAEYAQQLEAYGIPTNVERFRYQSPLPNLHSAHCFDLPFQFGNREAWYDAPMLEGIASQDFEEISGTMMRSLTNFIHQTPAS